MPQPEPLHPNLARLAAAYDIIYERWTRREIEPHEARGQIMALVTRDDQGVQWRIHPDTGVWQRQTIMGEWVEGAPPTYGLATPSAHDLSAGYVENPDERVRSFAVDEDLLFAPQSLVGATRRPQTEPPQGLLQRLGRARLAAIIVIAVVMLAVAGAALSRRASTTSPSSSVPQATAPSGPLGGR